MKIKLKTQLLTITLSLFFACQKDLELKTSIDEYNFEFDAIQKTELLYKKKHDLLSLSGKSTLPTNIHLNRTYTSKKTKQKFPTYDLEIMPTPYLPPCGKSELDIHYKNAFFSILDRKEDLRVYLEKYNTFIINNNVLKLSHPAQLHDTDDSDSFIKLRRFVKEAKREVQIVKDKINLYNREIGDLFPNVSHGHKMAGYYSFDRSHVIVNNLEEFSIEDVDYLSYSYGRRFISKNFFTTGQPKSKIHKPQVGTRRGTVFVNSSKPNVIRGTFGNDFGAYELGKLVGMCIEYAITGKLYYYK